MTTIARYKFGYSTDEWGMNRSLSLIADAAGDVCRFSDVEALRARVAELEREVSETYHAQSHLQGEVLAACAERDALQTRVVELEDKYLVEKGMRRLAVGERDALAAELAAIKNQEPVAWRMDWINHGPSFTADKSDYVTWFAGKESYPKELVPLFAAPVPELRGVTDAQGLPSMAAPAHTTGESSGHPTPPVQEPVSHRYRFTHPISGEPVWRDSSSTWNGQCVQEVQPLFAAPVPPVREPLSYRDILRIYNEVGPEDGVPYRFAGAIEAITKEQA